MSQSVFNTLQKLVWRVHRLQVHRRPVHGATRRDGRCWVLGRGELANLVATKVALVHTDVNYFINILPPIQNNSFSSLNWFSYQQEFHVDSEGLI